MSIAVVLGMVAYGETVGATTLLKRSLDELVQESDGVLTGRVSDLIFDESSDGLIYTFVVLADVDVIRGTYSDTQYVFRMEGGVIGDEVHQLLGAPTFERGEEIVLLISGNGSKIVPIAGWEQGVFRIETSASGDQKIMTDAVGNAIFDIRNGDVVKDKGHAMNAALVDSGQSESPTRHVKLDIEFFDANGNPLKAIEVESGTSQSSSRIPMRFEQFVQQLAAIPQSRSVLNSRRDRSNEMKSLDVGDMNGAVGRHILQPAKL